jgi:hypothetical protein
MAIIEELPDEPAPKPTLVHRIAKKQVAESVGGDISESEQERLIKETGVLNLMKQADEHNKHKLRPRRPNSLETAFLSVVMAMVFCVLHYALALHFDGVVEVSLDNPKVLNVLKRAAVGLPGIIVIIYQSQRYIHYPLFQYLLVATGFIVGVWNMRLMTKPRVTYNELSVSPVLGTVWAFCLVQMDILYASLVLLGTFSTHLIWQIFAYTSSSNPKG